VRPTQESLAHAAGLLEELAWTATDRRGQELFANVCDLLDLLVWVNGELDAARQAAGWGHGTDSTHTIGRHGLNRPVEGRLDFGAEDGRNQRGGPMQPPVEPSDPVYKRLRQLRTDWHRHLASVIGQWRHDGEQAANWPKRTEQTGA